EGRRLARSAAYQAPRTALEELLVGIWQQVLHIEPIGIHDHFFQIGGHSLLAARVISRVRNALQVEVPLGAFFKTPSIAELAVVIMQSQKIAPEVSKIGAVRRGKKKQDQLLDYESFPLSFAQQRLWFLDQWEAESPLYNTFHAMSLKGHLDVKALEESLNEIVRRHEILRTTFLSVEGQPIQVIAKAATLLLPLIDLQSLPVIEREEEAQRLMRQDARCIFDLEKGPLLRVRLLRLGEAEQVLLLSMHHIISDGWSLGVFFQELSALYTAVLRDQPWSLADLSLQYADYALWQRHWLQAEVLEQQLNYWREQLRGAPALLELPTDHPRPPVQTFRGGQQEVILPASMLQALHALSQQEGVTLFMTLLAAFQILLSRYSGQQDIVVGTPVANRTQQEIEGLIGCFINTLVLRTDLSGEPTFQQVLRRVREVTLGAYAHQDLPFEQLVGALMPERNESFSPLFQVLFTWQNTPQRDLVLPGVHLCPIEVENRVARFDLTLELIETAEEGIVGSLEYNTDLFEPETIERLIRQWQVMLEGIVAHPDQPIGQLPLLSTQEQNELLEWGKAPAPQYRELESFLPLFEQQVQERPEAIAVVFEQEQVSYAHLQQRANQLAQHLRRLGVGPEVRVGVCLQRNCELLTALLAVFKAGGAYVPLDPSYPADRLAFMIADAQISVLITQQSLLTDLFEQQEHLVCLESDWPSIAQESLQAPEQPLWGEQVAYVIYTSGSTGRPKGVQVRHRGLVNFLQTMQQQPGLRAQDVLLAVTTLSFDIAGLELFLPLISGARVVLASREVASDGMALLELVNSSAATIMQATPASWRLLLEAGWSGSEGIRVLCGGEALPLALAQQLLERSAQLWNMYGPTETTIWSMLDRVSADQPGISLGHPIGRTQIYLLDPRLQVVPRGAVGEL